jgi:hypothetical protein
MAEVLYEVSERDKVEGWRRDVLIEAGYPPDLAAELACSAADLHLAVDLLRRGCSPQTAAAILV